MKTSLSLLLALTSLTAGANTVLTLTSPDGRNTVTFSKPANELTYDISVDGKETILPSRAGLEVDNWAWEMALGKRDLAQPESWMDLLEVDSVTVHAPVDSVCI